MKDQEIYDSRDGGFGGDPEENFFRGEITYVDQDILLGAGRAKENDGRVPAGDAVQKEHGGVQTRNHAAGTEEYESADAYGDDEGYEGADAYEDDEEYESADAYGDDDGYEEAEDEEEGEFFHDEEVPVRRAKRGKRMKEEEKRPAGRRRKKKRGRFFKKLVLVFVLLAAVVLLGLYLVVQLVYGRMRYSEIESVKQEAMAADGVTNILLIGNDSRENGEDGRSDAMILLSVSSRTKRIQMTSLLRDMYVEIPGHEGNRLNAAYAFGGAQLLMETIEQNFGIEVNRYVQVNFEAFANLVDAAGGVDLELTNEEVQYVNGYLVEYNMLTGRPEGTDYLDTLASGMLHLNGPQALAYSRNRYIGTDFGRTERQRKVLTDVMKKLPQTILTNPKELAEGLLPNLTTNLTAVECYRLGLQAGGMLSYDIVQGSVPISGSYQNADIRGMAVLQVDFEANRAYLRSSIYGE